MKILEIIKPGYYSSIQDTGRFGHRSYAIPQSGSLDSISHRLANYLVGNMEIEATIEMIGGSFRSRVLENVILGITGASFGVKINGVEQTNNQSIQVKPRDILDIQSNCPTYLAVCGGFFGQSHFGSIATYPLAKLGGLNGTILKEGDVLIGNQEQGVVCRILPEQVLPKFSDKAILRVLKGSEYEKLKMNDSLFEARSWKISSKSNRMGIRLIGSKLTVNNEEMSSVPTFPGTIQLTHEGLPIVLMNDAQTTGGYPRIGQVIKADLPRLSRMILGGSIRFKFVEITDAKYILNQREAFINHALQ